MLLLKWSCNSVWTVDSQQYVLKSCTIAKQVFYLGAPTLFFCTAGIVPETFSFIVTSFLNFVQPLKEKSAFFWSFMPALE